VSKLPRLQWLIRQLADQCNESPETIERAFHDLIERGHLRVLPGAGPGGTDGLEFVIKDSGRPSDPTRWWLQ
jgi:hypothetical protein